MHGPSDADNKQWRPRCCCPRKQILTRTWSGGPGTACSLIASIPRGVIGQNHRPGAHLRQQLKPNSRPDSEVLQVLKILRRMKRLSCEQDNIRTGVKH